MFLTELLKVINLKMSIKNGDVTEELISNIQFKTL